MKVAVTGATGFIGKHVIAELAKRPVEIITVTRQPSYRPVFPQERVVILDLKDTPTEAFDKLGNPDVLIHLAWDGLPNYQSLHHFERELPSHYQFLQGMIKSGLRSLFVAGTCFEYGMQSGPLNETMDMRPNNAYGFAKDTLRQQLEYLGASHPFALTWGRLFYLHGDGQAAKSLLPQLIKAVELGDKEFNMSGGEQLRDYLPATDAAENIVSLALQQKNIGAVNICSGQPISVRNLVDGIIQKNNWKIKPNLGYYPYPDYEPMAFWGEKNKLNRYL